MTMYRLIASTLVVMFLALGALADVAPKNEYCPVTPTDRSEPDIHTEYRGETIYFCCKSCLRDFNKDPEAYLANLASENDSADHREHEHASASSQGHGSTGESEHGDSDHDHSDHGDSGSNPIISLLGKLHVLTVHFPVALIPFAALLAILGSLLRKPTFEQMADLSIYVGALAAFVAASMGWIAASQSSYPESLSQILEYHRWLGTVVAASSLLVSVFIFYRPETRLRFALYATLAILVFATGHFGGSLIYGPDYLF